LALSSRGGVWQLYVGHGVLIGLIGNGGINAPLYVYVSHWFDRRRGTALALISSGQYVAGALWPSLFERAIGEFGWRNTMVFFGVAAIAVIVPAAAVFLRPPPHAESAGIGAAESLPGARVLGFKPHVALALLSLASFLCCIPMAMPQGHLVAYCSDLGIKPAHGAAMLSVLLGTAFISRQCWGWISDRIGGLRTVLAGSACQVVALIGFLVTQDEVALFAVATAFGLGFSGVIPAYVLAVRQLFPASEAARRIPVLLLCSGSGMAAGGWLAGLLYDDFGFYAPAFATGIVFNLANLALVGLLVARQRSDGSRRGAALAAAEAA
jgi:MFS family permease